MRGLLAALLLAVALPSQASTIAKAKAVSFVPGVRAQFVSELKLHLGALSTRLSQPSLAASYLVANVTPEAPTAQALAREALLDALAKPTALAALTKQLDGATAATLEETAAALGDSRGLKKVLTSLRRDFAGDSSLREHGAELSSKLDALFDGSPAKVDLSALDPAETDGLSRKKAEKEFATEIARIQELQDMLYAQKKHRVLIVLQGMDTAGKDGIIKHVLKLNVAGAKVAKFGRPTEEELAHDFLWRIRPHVPAKGMITIFNRSHYEDILVPTVDKKLSPAKLAQRYAEINAFEKELADDGVTILKIFPHISKDEQKERLQARLDDPDKRWKWDDGDLVSRKKWSKFMKAYESIFALTSTPYAPWNIIPSDKKWYRNYAVAHLIREALESLDLRYPEAKPGLEGIVVK